MSWSEFLDLFVQPNGIALLLGVLLSILAEYLPKFKDLSPKWKRAVFFVIALVIPLVGCTLGILTAGWSPSWESTWWPALVAGGVAFASGTVAHIRKL